MNGRRRAAYALLLFSLTGCKTAPATSTETALERAVEAAAAEAPPQWLVWSVEGEVAKTELRDADGVVATAPGIWIGAGEHLWRYNQIKVDVEQPDCDCGPSGDCTTSVGLDLGELAAPGRPALVMPPSDFIGEGAQSSTVQLVGSVGPYAFTTACVWSYVCGAAHGGTVCTESIWDLRTGEQLDPHDVTLERLRGDAAVQFVYDSFDDEQEASQLQSEDVVLVNVLPLYEGDFHPRLEEHYTAATCYACSDGEWDSYTVSARRTVDTLPPAFERWFAANPPPAGAPPTGLRGWSVMPPTEAAADAFNAAKN